MLIIPVKDSNSYKKFDPRSLTCPKIIGINNCEYRIANMNTLESDVMLRNSSNVCRVPSGVQYCNSAFTACIKAGTFKIDASCHFSEYQDIHIRFYTIGNTMLFGVLFMIGSKAVICESKKAVNNLDDIIDKYLCVEILQADDSRVDILPCIYFYSQSGKKYFRYGSKDVFTEYYAVRTASDIEVNSIIRSML